MKAFLKKLWRKCMCLLPCFMLSASHLPSLPSDHHRLSHAQARGRARGDHDDVGRGSVNLQCNSHAAVTGKSLRGVSRLYAAQCDSGVSAALSSDCGACKRPCKRGHRESYGASARHERRATLTASSRQRYGQGGSAQKQSHLLCDAHAGPPGPDWLSSWALVYSRQSNTMRRRHIQSGFQRVLGHSLQAMPRTLVHIYNGEHLSMAVQLPPKLHTPRTGPGREHEGSV